MSDIVLADEVEPPDNRRALRVALRDLPLLLERMNSLALASENVKELGEAVKINQSMVERSESKGGTMTDLIITIGSGSTQQRIHIAASEAPPEVEMIEEVLDAADPRPAQVLNPELMPEHIVEDVPEVAMFDLGALLAD